MLVELQTAEASITVLFKVGFMWKENLEFYGFNVEKYMLQLN